MLGDGLRDVEDLLDPEEEGRKDALKISDAKSDVVGTNYLKIVNHMSFSNYAIYTVELPVIQVKVKSKKQK